MVGAKLMPSRISQIMIRSDGRYVSIVMHMHFLNELIHTVTLEHFRNHI